MSFRSRRLEALFGGPLSESTYEQIASLVGVEEAAEAEDLDYKQQLAAADPKGKEELAKDVCAFANHIGGVLVVGLAEARGVPSKAMDIDLSDAHLRHLEQVVGSSTAPAVRYETYQLHNPADHGRGFLIIAVPRSPQGPHAVITPPTKPTEKALRYPRRSGSRTNWLTETDIATAYHQRFTASASRASRLQDVEREGLAALPASNQPQLLVTVTPEVPGDMTITRETYNRYQRDLIAASPYLGDGDSFFSRVLVGSRRLIATSGQPDGYGYQHCELHRDGSGIWAYGIGAGAATADNEEFHFANLDAVVYELLSALAFLGAHARDRSGATGTALVKAALVEAPHTHPYGPPRPQLAPLLPFRIDQTDIHASRRSQLSIRMCPYADAEAVALVDDLADAGVPLVQTAAHIANELVQAFGIVEAAPITHDGSVNAAAWTTYYKARIGSWAEARQIRFIPQEGETSSRS
ncbi:helix-turn-helix domain-containing protein [Streptomyces sp. H27-H5]|uniref:AlbA family DNA-binding domain-containing protein n=1 Tax=Streptomyces sp. H27-H5 TaxID=2996460 RepID=UPI00226E4FC6|nr:ATP-binding protein [Streptomyces sp. H27-H5]MCY0958131.1 ATP-binding protein [Streptomyces sp. H27-H5]